MDELLITRFGPADYMETVNTMGLPYYASQVPMDHHKGVNLEAQSNPLNLCTRPRAIIKLTMDSSGRRDTGHFQAYGGRYPPGSNRIIRRRTGAVAAATEVVCIPAEHPVPVPGDQVAVNEILYLIGPEALMTEPTGLVQVRLLTHMATDDVPPPWQ